MKPFTTTFDGATWVVVEAVISDDVAAGHVRVPPDVVKAGLRSGGPAELNLGILLAAERYAAQSGTVEATLAPGLEGDAHVSIARDLGDALDPDGEDVELVAAVRSIAETAGARSSRRERKISLGVTAVGGVVAIVNEGLLADPNRALSVAGGLAILGGAVATAVVWRR